MFDDLFEEQSRTTEVVAGVAASLCGIFALGFAVWLYGHDVVSGRNVAARPIALITMVVGVYALVLARRLLASSSHRPRYLMSAPTLIIMGLLLVAGGGLPFLAWREQWSMALEGLILGGACIVLGIRRWRASDRDAA